MPETRSRRSRLRAVNAILGIPVIGMLVLAGCGAPTATPPAPTTEVAVPADLNSFYTQDIEWRNCGNADCTTFEVPLDYSDPGGATVTLSMTRVLATGESIGSLFVNPGGPGGSAVDYAKAADYVVTDSVRESFDVVGVDPRGVGLSDPVRCLTDEQLDAFISEEVTPDTQLEESRLILDSPMVAAACAAQNNPLIAHMSTVEVTRDMDIARALVGDPVMNMMGKSYGTAIAATYTQLFPERVGRMVLDGVLPTYLDQFEVTREQTVEFELLFRYFVEDCLERSDCPVSGTVDQGAQTIRDFLLALDAQPLVGNGGRDLTEGLAAYAILSYLYFPEYDFDQLRPALSAAMTESDPDPLLDILDQRIDRAPDGRYTTNSSDAFYSVTCLDLPVSASVDQIRSFATELEAVAPTFGQALGWGVLTCREWPYTGGVRPAITPGVAPPVMIVVTEFDPATPARWGFDLAQKLGNAEVVEWEGAYNHTAYNEGSDCVTDRVNSFLLEGVISPGTTTICS
ncbi:MAG: alpha/beta hydrolase [Candidatus Nanopelagicales bacterium]|nr:alpha/beta hydrolase [Candidatus Nanopelagicales bacterium]